mmetsp:Transcript_4275/g.4935  ORF Transcript_4275/g.4935 Transcript_4275/m.4935 type:complete len:144 (+) Transcript_4275:2-433(+)
MILASISQSRLKNRIKKDQDESSLGLYMMDFLQTYGRDFDPKRDAVICLQDINTDSPVQLGSKRVAPGEKHSNLVVHDPVSPGNNVGRSCFRFESVQKVFADALASLLSSVLRFDTTDIPSKDCKDTENLPLPYLGLLDCSIK